MSKRRQIPSPCVGVCMINPDTELCIGCWRNMDEITGWPKLNDNARLALVNDLERRQRAAGADRRRQTRRRRA